MIGDFMHGLSAIDPGRTIDWGKTTEDYAKYRPGPPSTFYDKLKALDVGLNHQSILDLGTGTGVIAREFSKRGTRKVCGSDISEVQVKMAAELAVKSGLQIRFETAPAEQQPFKDKEFDVITANQCWLYFDKSKVIPEVKRLLKSDGVLVTGHFSWLPRLDKVARGSEELIMKFNPQWTAADYHGEVPAFPKWAEGHFRLKGMFYYDEQIPFDIDTWRGRMRACRGIGAALSDEEVKRFDKEHEKLLRETLAENFTVLHRIDAHIFEPV
jgi:SAM-dependent methyltransferase